MFFQRLEVQICSNNNYYNNDNDAHGDDGCGGRDNKLFTGTSYLGFLFVDLNVALYSQVAH